MNIVGKNGQPLKTKFITGDNWETAIDYCVDNFDKEEAKKRIKKYVSGLDAIYHKPLKLLSLKALHHLKMSLKKE